MRNVLPLAALISLTLALPAAAQSSGGGSGGSASGASGASGAAGAGAAPGQAHLATSHAETARRLMARRRPGEQQIGPARTEGVPQVAAAAKAADDAVANDPTVKAMLNGAMAKPPSLAGGAPGVPPPPKSPAPGG